MSSDGSVTGKVGREESATLLVRDAMVHRPKTLPAHSTVADLREHFANPRVRTALLSDGGRFAGAIAPEELADSADGSEPARDHVRMDVPTVGPEATMADALELMDRRGDHRLVVLDADGATLVGLLCLDRTGSSFCVGR